MESIKERIRRLCRENGITAAELERLLGFGSGYITKLEKSTPSTKKMQAIANYFDVPIKYILTGEEEKEEPRQSVASYYYDKNTAAVAQKIYDSRALSLLFDEAKDASPEDLMLTYSILKRLKDKERMGD